jgi:hypothetical protein
MKTPEEFFKSRLQKPDKDNYYHIPADLLHEYMKSFASQSQPSKKEIVDILVKYAKWSEEHGHDIVFDILFTKVAKDILALYTPITNNYKISNTEGKLHNIADPDYPKNHE